MVLGLLFFRQIAGAIDYGTQARCLFYFVLIVAFDTYAVIPFARLRLENRALRYAVIRLAGIALTAAMNLLLICVLPHYGVMRIDVESVFWVMPWGVPWCWCCWEGTCGVFPSGSTGRSCGGCCPTAGPS